MFAAGKSVASAKQVVAAVRFQARLAGRRPPTGPLVERALRGYARRGAEVSRRGQVQGIRWEQADAAAAVAANAGLRGSRDAALVAVMSDGLLRVSEAAALDLADLNLEDQALAIRRSKTDQEGAGAVVYTGRPTLERLKAWIQAAGITEGALFRRVGKSGKVGGRLTVRSLRRIIQARARAAGIGGRVSGHSLRVGQRPVLWRLPGLRWSRCSGRGAGRLRKCPDSTPATRPPGAERRPASATRSDPERSGKHRHCDLPGLSGSLGRCAYSGVSGVLGRLEGLPRLRGFCPPSCRRPTAVCQSGSVDLPIQGERPVYRPFNPAARAAAAMRLPICLEPRPKTNSPVRPFRIR